MDAAGRRRRIARVLLDSPLPQLDHLFDYRLPEPLVADAAPGVRVRVPLRSAGRVTDGFLIELVDEPEGFSGTLSDVEQIVSPVPVLTEATWRLARAVADRGAGSAIDVVRLAVPPRQVRVEKAWLASGGLGGVAGGAAVNPDGAAANPGVAPAADPAANEADHPSAPPAPEVTGYDPAAIATLLGTGGRAALDAIPRVVDAATTRGGASASDSSPEQGRAHATVRTWAVTFAQLAAGVFHAGRSVIVAVPDYRDEEQLLTALDAVGLTADVVRTDARQSNADRYRGFLRALSQPSIIVGNRSVVYAAAVDLGAILLWDDGDPLFAEPLAPYAHARDAALIRQSQQPDIALVFAAHSRSVETQRLVQIGWFDEIAPLRRATPRVVVTEHQSSDPDTSFARIPSSAWRAASDALASGPVLVQVARPGYAPVLACATCRQAARCPRCAGPLGQSAPGAAPACAWCGAIATRWECDNCGSHSLRYAARGSARTAEELGRAFPGHRVVVADGEHPVESIAHRPTVVVATPSAEPLVEGGYAAVLLLDGDRMLARESLRVAEDCLRWWSNAAALAAPGAPVFLVGVAGGLAAALSRWAQPAYAAAQLGERRALDFPPAIRLATVTGPAEEVTSALATLDDALTPLVLGPTTLDDGQHRAIVRFDYARGSEVAVGLRSAVIRSAVARRRPLPKSAGRRRAPTLRVHFDDPEIL